MSYKSPVTTVKSISDIVIDVDKDWNKKNIVNFGSGGINLYSMVTSHASRHSLGGADQLIKKRIVHASGTASTTYEVTVFSVGPSPGFKIFTAIVCVAGTYRSPSSTAPSGYKVVANYSDGTNYTLGEWYVRNGTVTISSTQPHIVVENISTTKDPAPDITSLSVNVLPQGSYYPVDYYILAVLIEVKA